MSNFELYIRSILFANDDESGSAAIFLLLALVVVFILLAPSALGTLIDWVNSSPNIAQVRALVGK